MTFGQGARDLGKGRQVSQAHDAHVNVGVPQYIAVERLGRGRVLGRKELVVTTGVHDHDADLLLTRNGKENLLGLAVGGVVQQRTVSNAPVARAGANASQL